MLVLLKTADGLRESIAHHYEHEVLEKWYPLVLDVECGGYYTNLTNDWRVYSCQDKMIVTQARHIWATAEAASILPAQDAYTAYARHGVAFLSDFMWDKQYGGFFQIRNRRGGYSECRGWREEKRTYGNAFAILALARFYRLTRDPAALDLAKETFHWLENHAFDPLYGGYHQFLTRTGEVIDSSSTYQTDADDKHECGYKDVNSSLHLLEAYTELYRVWRDRKLKAQLTALFRLIRDTMADERGYMRLFFQRDWTPVSFRSEPAKTRMLNYALDHVSFGHDCLAALYLLDASYVLGLENDVRTLLSAQRLIEHMIVNAWDQQRGGFFEGGYYLQDSSQCTIIRPTKTWWAQAEALNALLLFSRIFPSDHTYSELFGKQWEYINAFLIDHRHGDWFEGGVDQEPSAVTGPKSHIWKCTYHASRAMINCLALLNGESHEGTGMEYRTLWLQNFIDHWKRM